MLVGQGNCCIEILQANVHLLEDDLGESAERLDIIGRQLVSGQQVQQ